MSVGRKRKPAEIHLLEGTRANYKDDDAPKFDSDYPARPPHLKDVARQEWDRLKGILEPLGMVTKADRAMLVALVEAWAIYREMDRLIKVHGVTYTTKTKSGDDMVRPRPEVAMRDQALKNIKSFSTEFGLTPSARTRVSIPNKPKQPKWKK